MPFYLAVLTLDNEQTRKACPFTKAESAGDLRNFRIHQHYNISDGRFQLCYYVFESMNKSGYWKLSVLVVLFLVVVMGSTAWVNGIPLTWQLFIVPVLAGLVGTVFLWLFWQRHLAASKRQSAQLLAQDEEIRNLRKQEKSHHLEQTRLKQALKQTKGTADQALSVRTTFLNNIGHELRTPLSVILGYADLVLQKAQQEEATGFITLTQKIKLYTKELSAIVNDLLQMSEIESGQVGFLLEAFGIDAVIEQAVQQTQTYLDVNENDLLLMVPPDIGMMVADRDKIRIILVNLLNNAAKFTKNGTITLSAKQTIMDDQSWIIFQVADTGIGISQEQQTQIFQPFLQGDNSVTKEHEGVGLGLAISQHYCQLMGGRIELESVVGEGSTFSVYLPAEVTAVAAMFVRSSSATQVTA